MTANSLLRAIIVQKASLPVLIPPPVLCTDNGAMSAWAGVERLHAGLTDPLDVPALARWPLDAHAKPMPFAGKKA